MPVLLTFIIDGNGHTTRWTYNNVRGWLTGKTYADNQGPSYTYWPSGRLKTRTWARGVTATYGYNNAGDLASISYGDATPGVSYAYDRTGRPQTVTDGAGTRTLSYHSSGQLQNEAYTAGLLSGLAVNRSFDSLDRPSGLAVLATGYSLPATSYTYDAASRLQTVTSGANSATYGYLANSSLIGTVTLQNGGATRLTTTKAYDNLNRLTSISHAPGASPSALSYAYAYNAANQRTAMTDATGDTWRYGYDALGQVTSAQKQKTDGAVRLGYDYAYTFDALGNRKTTAANGLAAAYTANLLNQYTQRQAPANVYVRGTAAADAYVTVEEQPAVRQDEAFALNVAVDAASTPLLKTVKAVAVKNSYGPANEDLVAEQTRTVFVPHPPEAFTHDLDGNLTQDGRWSYSWDAENRLTAMETRPDVAVALPALKQRLEFAYDSQGRRIQKKVSNWDSGSSSWLLATSSLFLYDGWNLVAELNGLTNLAGMRSYIWGIDLSGSLQGAGGVGGLLAINVGSATYLPAYDGNGNVLALVDASSGTTAAEYEYGPFGEPLNVTGTAAAANPFRFSTKYEDAETGFYYYGFRYYCPSTGRWLSRDPSEEDGGTNLYGFVGNDPIDGSDPLGLVGGVIGNRPFTAQEVEGARNRAFNLITYFGGVGEGLPQKLLRQWLWKRGDYTLTDAEFNEAAWGDKNYHAIHPNGVSSDQVGLLSLNMIPQFKSDLESKCSKGGDTFKGSYMLLDYANTGRTLGNFFWYIDVAVKCGCKKGDYNASGVIYIHDRYDFDPGNRIPRDESDVAKMRWFHRITGMGQDFWINSNRYPIVEDSPRSSIPVDRPFLERK